MNNLFEQSKATGKPYWDIYAGWLQSAAVYIKEKYGITLLFTTERSGFPGVDALTGLNYFDSYTVHAFAFPGVQYQIPSDRLIVVTAGDAKDAGERLLFALAVAAGAPMPTPFRLPLEPAPYVSPIGAEVGPTFPRRFYVNRSSPDANNTEVTVGGVHYVAVYVGGFAGAVKMWEPA